MRVLVSLAFSEVWILWKEPSHEEPFIYMSACNVDLAHLPEHRGNGC